MAKKQFTTTIDEKLLQQLKIKALEQGRNANDILEELLREYLSKN